MNKIAERLYNGIIKENPTFVLTLGMCPTLAVTTSAINGLGMGLTTAAVLAMSNLFISLLRKVIPNKVRIPAFIVIVASFVTMVQLLLEAYLPSLNASLGIYIPLIVVNCIILGRAESYAYHNPPIASFFDGVGMGLGFTVALTLLGIFREFIGSGTFFGMRVFPEEYGITIFVLAPGAFFVLAALVAVQNYIKEKLVAKGKDVSKIGSGCGTVGCAGCPQHVTCSKPEAKKERKAEAEEKRKALKEAETEEKKQAEKEAEERRRTKESEEKVKAEKEADKTLNNHKASDTEEKAEDIEKSEDKEKAEHFEKAKTDKSDESNSSDIEVSAKDNSDKDNTNKDNSNSKKKKKKRRR